MSGNPAVKPKTGARKQTLNKPKEADKVEDTTNDENFARQLQDQLMREQEERDAELARQLQEEEQSKRRAMSSPHMAGNMGRPMSATPIRQLFTTMFGLRPETLEVEDEEENTTPAMEPDSEEAVQATARITQPSNLPPRLQGAIGGRSEPREVVGRSGIPRPSDRGRRGAAARSPERPVRGRGAARGPFIRVPSDSSSATNREDTSDSPTTENPADLLPGVRVNPVRQGLRPGARRFGPGRRFVFHSGPPVPEEPEVSRPNPRPIAPPVLGLGPRQATMDLPDGEYDPDFMVLDLGENEVQREANFVNVMRDPFLLMLLLMGRNPGLMVPDDVDMNDYEALWELAERVGEVRGRGMKDEEINRLPCRTYRKKAGSTENESCSICISDYKTADNVQILPCKHEFHKDCLSEWLKRNGSCPVCRQDVKKKPN
ncbi:E3 ubiquitin-protein ligase rnf38 [Mactra antiquata]